MMSEDIKKEAVKLAISCFTAGQTFQAMRYDLNPKRREYFEKEIIKLIDKAIQAAIETKDSELEQARKEGYEVGYVQAEAKQGLPKSIIEEIKREATLAERKRCEDVIKEWPRNPEMDEELIAIAEAIQAYKIQDHD